MRSNPIYLVCDQCGWFSGNLRLYTNAAVKCDDCGAERLSAFSQIDAALLYQESVREGRADG